MRDFRDPVEINKCLYPYNPGVFQINVERCIDSNLSWSPIIEIPAGQREAPHYPSPKLFHTMIICALHPTLFPNKRVSWLADRLRLQYIKGIDFVYPQSQFCTDSSTVFCDIPHLYPTTEPTHTFSDTEDASWNAFNAIISLLQTNFLFCQDITLVLWTKNRVSRHEPLPPHNLVKARFEKVLRRVDELFCVLAPRGCNFTFFPSPNAFDIYLNQAKETGGAFNEGNTDLSRGAESRVWRSVIGDPSNGEALKGCNEKEKAGYWVQSNFFDWMERPNMQFV